MPSDSPDLAALPLASTLFLPLTGNPAGFHHFASAEWMLRRDPALRRVAFILSNGRHPDPTKPGIAVDAETRLAILRAAIAAVADPARSVLARRAQVAGEALRVSPENLLVSTLEFAHARAVPTAETLGLIRSAHGSTGHSGALEPIRWFAGSDLVRRMAEPRIFSDPDVRVLARECRYLLLEREGDPVAGALAHFRERRGLALDARAHPLAEVPGWLAPFLALSSTRIRHATEAGDPLEAMLPATAADLLRARGLYRPADIAARLVDLEGRPREARSSLQLELERLQQGLDAAALALAEALLERRAAGLPHTFSLVETSAGGALTLAMAGRSGASRYFKQGRFAYDQLAKESLLGRVFDEASAVSEAMARALAEAMRRAADTAFALAETGMAGPPDGQRRSLKSGICCLALATPDGTHSETYQTNPYLTRREHMLLFARRGLEMGKEEIRADEGQ